jgi:hypothetical protein
VYLFFKSVHPIITYIFSTANPPGLLPDGIRETGGGNNSWCGKVGCHKIADKKSEKEKEIVCSSRINVMDVVF